MEPCLPGLCWELLGAVQHSWRGTTPPPPAQTPPVQQMQGQQIP